MPNSFTSSSDATRLIRRLALFAGGLALLYAVALGVLAAIPAPGDATERYSLYQFVARDVTLPGGYGYTLTRYREIEQHHDIDLLFLGSSRCYYSFSPQVFQRLGLSSFNMGSPSQTPLNSYYLLKRFYDRLNPKLVIFEINHHILQKDGVESFLDLMINQPLSWEMIAMGLATRDPHALNSLCARTIASLHEDFDTVRMQPRPMDEYVTGGAVVARNFNEELFNDSPMTVDIFPRQTGYIGKIVDYVQAHGGRILLVVAPVPGEWKGVILNYGAVTEPLKAMAMDRGVRLFDFNEAMALDARTFFKDFHHLNANGAKIFSYDVVDSLLDVSDYREILQIEPALAAEVYNGRGITFAQQGEWGRAIEDYHRALALTPDNGMIAYNLARACEQAGQREDAIVAYRSFIDHADETNRSFVEPVKQHLATLETP